MSSVVEIKALSVLWGRQKIVENLEFCLESGELVCLCGPNGVGKSTVIKAILGKRENGLKVCGDATVKICGQDFLSLKARKKAELVSVLEQCEDFTWNAKVNDVVLTGRFCKNGNNNFYTVDDRKKVNQILYELGIRHLSEKGILEISGGERQLVRLARCLAQETEVLILDEPFSNLDMENLVAMMKLLKKIAMEQNKAILLVIHDFNMACQFADRLLMLSRDRSLIAGLVSEVVTEDNIERLFGNGVGIYKHPSGSFPQIYFK